MTCKLGRDGLAILLMLLLVLVVMHRAHIFHMLFVAHSPLRVALRIPFCDGTSAVVTLMQLESLMVKLLSRGARDWLG